LSKGITFHKSKNLILVRDKDTLTRERLEIFIAKRTRLHLYFGGIRSRLVQIYDQYLLEDIPILNEGTGWIIDIGANVGEFSLTIAREDSHHRFLLIEPSQSEMFAARKNMQNYSADYACTALWSEEKDLLFYHANETGDSSLLPADLSRPSEILRVRTLDSVISEFQIGEIDVLKLEAEGAEPEILQGATHTLSITRYLTADLGPERGIRESRTYEECRTILISAGFVEIATFSGGRETYLFRNNNFYP
jgi:FkbM family methyltransferase